MVKDPSSAVDELQAELARLRQRVAELEAQKGRDDQDEEDLWQEHEFCNTVVNSLNDAIYIVSAADFTILYCNKVFLQQLGLAREQVTGRPCYDFTSQRQKPCPGRAADCHALKTLNTGLPSMAEYTLIGPEGLVRYFECTTLPVLDRQEQVKLIVHVHRDITRRKQAWLNFQQANQELSRSNALRMQLLERFQEANRDLSRLNAFLLNLIMSSVDAVIAADRSGRIVIFNQAAGKVTGYSEQEALNHINIRDVYPGDGARQVMALLRNDQYGGKGKLESHEVQLLCKDGTQVPISLSAAVVMDGDVEVGTVGFFYDLREKRRMERELNKTRVQLLQAEKMASMGKLAAGVAHQLNNPLAGITLYANILAEEYDLPEEARQDLQRILDNAQRSRDTIKELLQFARQTRREIRLANLNEALTRTLFLLGNQSQFRNIEIVRRLDPSLPLVPADIQQLNHVFMNIVLNAAEAMEGRGRMEVATRLDPERRKVIVEIADSGPGIPAEVLPHIFEPFFTTKEEGKGTGLGLSVAFGIVEDHNGKITAHSSPGRGTRFVIELPLRSNAEE